MTPLRLGRRGGPLVCAVALVACRASLPSSSSASPPGTPAPPPSGFVVSRYVESQPITAILFHEPYLWAGTAHGLRRWKVGEATQPDIAIEGDAEVIGAASGLPGRAVSALGADGGVDVWVATEAGIGRLLSSGPPGRPQLRYEAHGTLPGISLLVGSTGDGSAWAGGLGGLFRFDGRAWTAMEFLRDVAVTSLELDADGISVWVGTRSRGLFLVGDHGGKPILGPGGGTDADEVVGTAPSKGGARVVAVRSGDGGRVIFVTKDGPDEYRTQPGAGTRFVRLVASGGDPILIAGAPGLERLYRLAPLPRGESPVAGGFRLVSTHKGSTTRYAATPMKLAVPPDVTVTSTVDVGSGSPEIWVGARAMGVARAEATRPRYLPGDLTEDSERLSVACAAIDRCLVVAGGAHAWSFDGAGFREARIGESPDGRALAVVTDGAGTIFGVMAQPPWNTLSLTQRLPGAGADARVGGADPHGAADAWQTVEKVPLDLGGDRPSVSFAAFSPSGSLWLGLGAVAGGGQEQGRGALEIALATHRIVRHGPVEKRGASPESLPLSHDLTGVIFDGDATWFSSRSGISRWQESELRHWGENEHMDSEVCFGLGKGLDGKIWAATTGGVGRYDGTEWRFAADDNADAALHAAVRGVINDGAGRMWLATSKGLRVLRAPDANSSRLGAGELVVGDEMLDLTLDRFGRVWALGVAALVIVDGSAKP